MNEKLKVTLLVSSLVVAIMIIIKFTLSNYYVTSPVTGKDKIFMTGSIDDVKYYLDHSERGVHLINFYSLIRRDRNDILEMVIRDYNYRADLNAEDLELATPLYFSAQEFKPESVKTLIKYGADVNYQDPYGMTPLIVASYTTTESENPASIEITKMLVEAGADINVVSEFGKTAIEGALFSNDLERVKYLVNHGGDISHLSYSGLNYMFFCNTLECYKYFINQGLDINSTDYKGKSVFQNAHYGNISIELSKSLLALGADICHKDNEGDTVLAYVERQNTTIQGQEKNTDRYQNKVKKNRQKDNYRYLQGRYNDECLVENQTEVNGEV